MCIAHCIRERKENIDSLKKGERSSMLLCTCMYVYKLYKDAHNRIYTQTSTGSRNGLENHMHTQTDIKENAHWMPSL